VVLEDNLARESRDHCQNDCHKPEKHVLYRILQNFSKTLICGTFEHSLTVVTLATDITWFLEDNLARQLSK